MFEALRPVVVVISLLSFSFSFSFLVWLFSGFSAFFSVALSFFLIFGHLLLFCFAFLFAVFVTIALSPPVPSSLVTEIQYVEEVC